MQMKSVSQFIVEATGADSAGNELFTNTKVFDNVTDAQEFAKTLLLDDTYSDGGRVSCFTRSATLCTADPTDMDEVKDAPEVETKK